MLSGECRDDLQRSPKCNTGLHWPLEIASNPSALVGPMGRWWTCVPDDERLSHLPSIGVQHTNVRVESIAPTARHRVQGSLHRGIAHYLLDASLVHRELRQMFFGRRVRLRHLNKLLPHLLKDKACRW